MNSDELCRYIKLYHQTVYRAALGMLHNAAEADDIVQETFVKLFGTHKSFNSDEHCKAWLIKVAVNLSKNLLRSFRYSRTETLGESIPIDVPEEHELADALSALPTKYRAVIHLFYFERYSSKEIADILGLSVSSVTTRLSRAREKLKSIMTADEKSDNKTQHSL